MPAITVFNPKGGSGKTTTALILATELAARGASVAVLDGDPNPNLYRWAERRGMATLNTNEIERDQTDASAVLELIDGKVGGEKFVVVRCQDSVVVPDWLDALSRRFAFVIADPEGTANDWVNRAAMMSDLVIIPMRPSPMDAEQMIAAVKLLESQAVALRRAIPFRLLFTCCSGLIQTRDEKEIRQYATAKGHTIMRTTLAERAAYRAMVAKRKTLQELAESGADAVSGVDKARVNALALVAEVLEAVGIKAAA